MSSPRVEPVRLVLARVISHLTRTVPDLDEDAAHAALADAVAVKGKALRELDACLTAHPDALRVGTSDCPPSLVRLAHVLQHAGHPVQPPKCSACGRSPDYLRAAPGGRLCSRCASRTSRIECARCGREGRVAARRADGVICYTCYGKDSLVTEVCGKCGRSALPVARLPDGASLCRNCYVRPVRTCIDCGQLRPTKILVEAVRSVSPATSVTARAGVAVAATGCDRSPGVPLAIALTCVKAATRVERRPARCVAGSASALGLAVARWSATAACPARVACVRGAGGCGRSTPNGPSGRSAPAAMSTSATTRQPACAATRSSR